MVKFEVGKKYNSEKLVLFNDDSTYTCVKRTKTTVTFHDSFYNENFTRKIKEDCGKEYVTVEGYIEIVAS